jgi:hypothetical protein
MRITKELPVDLTDGDLAVAAEQLVDVIHRREALTAEKKSVNDGYAKQIAATDAEETQLCNMIDKRTKLVDVECLETEVPGTNEVVVVRLDTGAEVSRRTITPEESQGDMFADESEDELRGRVLATLALQDVLKKVGVNATSDVLWEISPEQADEARAYAAAKEAATGDEQIEQPAWLAELILSHPTVEELPTEPVAEAEAGESAAGADETASEAAPAAETESPAAAEPAAPAGDVPAADTKAAGSGGKGKSGKKKAARKDTPAAEAGAQAKHAAAVNGRLDEVDVQEELDKAGVGIGLDVIAGWKPEQLIEAVNYARVVVARVGDSSIEEPKRPAFLPA